RAASGLWASFGAGAHALYRGAVRGATAIGETRLSASASHERSEGWNAIVDPNAFSYNPDRDGWRVTRGSVELDHRLDRHWNLSARGLVARSNSQYDGGAGQDDRALVDLSLLSAGARYTAGPLASELALAEGRETSEFRSAFPGRYVTCNQQAHWQGSASLAPGLRGQALLEWRRERIESSDALPVTSRTTKSVLVGAEWHDGPVRLAGHLRLDDSNQFGRRTTGSLSAGWQWTPALRLAVNTGTAFKAPTFNDLYYPGFANPNLQPETSRSIDAQLLWQAGPTRLALTGYRSDVRELIQFICDANFNCAPQNVARARLTGATLSASHTIGAMRIEAAFDALDAKNRITGKRLPRRAQEAGQLTVSGPLLTGLEASGTLRAVGRRFDDAANRSPLPAYEVLDLSARWSFAPGWQLAAGVDNVFDRDYETARGYATGGRRWRLEITGRL
ncbi:MAG: TonB-dependent receptor domain-containing protein, partial [Casimicrobiaceae bacterium]